MKKIDWTGVFIWGLIILISVEIFLSLFMIIGNVLTLMWALMLWFVSGTIYSNIALWVYHRVFHRYDRDAQVVCCVFFGTAVGILFRLLS